MHVAELWRYPVKSMAGEALEETWIGTDGIPGDRVLYVVDGRGQIVSARTRPRLLAHRAAIDADGDVRVDGRPWQSAEVAAAVRAAAGCRSAPGPGRGRAAHRHPDTLAQDVDVLRDLNVRFGGRFGGRFALNAWAGRPGHVSVGDPVASATEPPELALPAAGRFA